MVSKTKYLEFYNKISLLEIATIIKYPECIKYPKFIKPKKGSFDFVTGVDYANAYAKKLKRILKKEKYNVNNFNKIEWESKPFKDFKILKENPPRRLESSGGKVRFEEKSSIAVNDWGEFIRSFCQVRNNLVHGAKFLKEAGLDLEDRGDRGDRDDKLISAALAFIEFLENEKLISLQ